MSPNNKDVSPDLPQSSPQEDLETTTPATKRIRRNTPEARKSVHTGRHTSIQQITEELDRLLTLEIGESPIKPRINLEYYPLDDLKNTIAGIQERYQQRRDIQKQVRDSIDRLIEQVTKLSPKGTPEENRSHEVNNLASEIYRVEKVAKIISEKIADPKINEGQLHFELTEAIARFYLNDIKEQSGSFSKEKLIRAISMVLPRYSYPDIKKLNHHDISDLSQRIVQILKVAYRMGRLAHRSTQDSILSPTPTPTDSLPPTENKRKKR
ncbi:hypothetical protein CVV38_01230 [Candidatus Peregrinibacteria bacterium HGW-Peregrinibacteria-1]|jgi:hypothetical protein|nr:MAG: hypothetical protein CVV38_01230 [Candidatus Peregrinibacteria bacterium HGW-Peregrinibacteria-1]